MEDQTIKFHVTEDSNREMKRILTSVYCSLSEKGYNPINQITGYLFTGDATYITPNRNARNLIVRIERDELIEALLREYFRREAK